MTLPDGWRTKTLRDLATINYGRDPRAILSDDGEYPVYGTSGSERRGTGYLYDGESIILGRKGTIERVHFASGRFWTIDTAYFLSDFGESVPRWLYYSLCNRDLRALNEATGVPSLSRDVLYKLKTPTPPPPEQAKIAEVLSIVDRAIEQTEAVIAKQQRIKTGLMQDLLTRGIDEHGNLRSEQTHKFKDSPLGRIPVEWEVKQVVETGSVTLGRQLSPKYMKGKTPTPYLRVANVYDGWIDYSDILAMDFTEREKAKYFLRPGDILLNEGQSRELVGRSAIFGGPPSTYCFQNTLVRYRANEGMRPEFAQAVFKRWLDTGVFADVARQTTSVAHLGADRFARMLIARPEPDEQERIVSVLLSLDHVLRREGETLCKLKALKRGLMQDLLSGDRRVTALLKPREAVTA